MFAASGQNSGDGTDVAKIAAVSDGDMLFRRLQIVRRIEINPAGFGTKDREPRVGSVGAKQSFLIFRGMSPQVAADVTRRQAERAQARDGEMREILADATAFFPDLLERRGNRGGRGVVDEILEDAPGQVAPAIEQRRFGGKTLARVIGQIEGGAHLRRVEDELIRLDDGRRNRVAKQGGDRFPRRDAWWLAGLDGSQRHAAAGDDFQPVVTLLDGKKTKMIAEIIPSRLAQGRAG